MAKTDAEIEEISSKIGVNKETVKKILAEVPNIEKDTDLKSSQIKSTDAQTNKTNWEATRLKTLTPWEEKIMEQEFKAHVTRNNYLDAKERAELNNLVMDTKAKANQMRVDWAKLSIEQRKNEIQQYAEETARKYPTIQQVMGSQSNKLVNVANKIATLLGDYLGVDTEEIMFDQMKK